MSETLKIQIRFLSDWHVGEGAGARGHVDAIVRRHPLDGLPYVPAKTLTGILRDGCERVAYGLDSGKEQGPWHALLRHVFGSNQEDTVDPTAREACLSVGPATLGSSLRRAIVETPGMSEALVFIKPGVKLDDQGVAESQMLRFEEAVLAGAELQAPIALNRLSGEARDAALALVAAGALAVERLGAKRRRGSGRCTLTLTGWDEPATLVDQLKKAPAPPAHVTYGSDLALAPAVAMPTHSDDWRVVALDLDLEAPVIVPAETLGNVVTSQDHIPGSLLLPALHGWLHHLLGAGTTSAVASGAVQVRNAYPASGGLRMFPVPASLFKLKEGDDTINQLCGEALDKRQRKQLRAGYVASDALPEVPARVVSVDRIAVTHATIEDNSQRPTGAVGGVFTYQAVRPGQRLVSELWISRSLCESEDALADWLSIAPKFLQIGRAKKDDYGCVSLSCREVLQSPPEAKEGNLTVWLVSPILLRDAALAPVMDAAGLAEHLAVALGLDREALKPSQGQPSAYLRPWRDDGWNSAWRMRRATRFGIAPGSCVSFHVSGTLTAQALARVQAAGIGERRGEGYGELVFNPKLLAELEVPIQEMDLDIPPTHEVNDPSETDFSAALQRRAARLAIRRKALECAEGFRRGIGWMSGRSPLPPNTQLGALRALMESVHDQAGLDRIASWLTAVEGNEKRRDKWPDDTKRALANHVQEESAESIWVSLNLFPGPTALKGHDASALARAMRVEAVKTLWLTAISTQLNDNSRSPDERKEHQEVGHVA